MAAIFDDKSVNPNTPDILMLMITFLYLFYNEQSEKLMNHPNNLLSLVTEQI